MRARVVVDNDFIFSNASVIKWLVGVAVAALISIAVYPPWFRLCIVGISLFIIGSVANSYRTKQWYSWQLEGSMNWFEGWAVSTGLLLIALPLVAAAVRGFFF